MIVDEIGGRFETITALETVMIPPGHEFRNLRYGFYRRTMLSPSKRMLPRPEGCEFWYVEGHRERNWRDCLCVECIPRRAMGVVMVPAGRLIGSLTV